jgi:BASS family bile acid:Na+ symporter
LKTVGTLSLFLLLAVILAVQFRMLAEISLRGYFGMLCLVITCIAAGRLMGQHADGSIKGMVITTSVRNVGVGLVIATASFPGTAAISSITAYALLQTLLMAGVALIWGRMTPTITLVKKTAA